MTINRLYVIYSPKTEMQHVKKYNLLQIFNIILKTEISITLHWNLAYWLIRFERILKCENVSYQSQYRSDDVTSKSMLCPPLSCSTGWAHHQPKCVTSEYFTWETGPWVQEKHHQMSQVSSKPTYAPDVLTLAQYWDVGIDLQGSDGVRSWDLQNGGESGSSMNQDSCCRKEMVVHVSTNARMRGSQGTASLRSTITAEEVWWCGVSYSTSEKLNWCTSSATLAPLDTEMGSDTTHAARNEHP